MGTKEEIMALEERLRMAELGPDPAFFEDVLADDAILDGKRLKKMVVEAHRPGTRPKFSKVEMSDFEILDYGMTAVVLCNGAYTNPKGTFSMAFMRVWTKRDGRWQIIAGTTQTK